MVELNARIHWVPPESARSASASGSRTTSTGTSRATATGARRCRSGSATRASTSRHRQLAEVNARGRLLDASGALGAHAPRSTTAQAGHRRRDLRLRRLRREHAAHERRARLLVRLGRDALRAVPLAARARSASSCASSSRPTSSPRASTRRAAGSTRCTRSAPSSRSWRNRPRGRRAGLPHLRRQRPRPRQGRGQDGASASATSSTRGRRSTSTAPTRCAGTCSRAARRGSPSASTRAACSRRAGASSARWPTATSSSASTRASTASIRAMRASRRARAGARSSLARLAHAERAAEVRARLAEYDLSGAAARSRASSSTSSRTGTSAATAGASGRASGADKLAAFATLHEALRTVACARADRAVPGGDVGAPRARRGLRARAALARARPELRRPRARGGMRSSSSWSRWAARCASARTARPPAAARDPRALVGRARAAPARRPFAREQVLDELNIKAFGSLGADDGKLCRLRPRPTSACSASGSAG